MRARVFRSCATLVVVMLAMAAAGCGDSATAPSSPTVFSSTDVVVGTGSEVIVGSLVTANYAGWFFDASKTNYKGVQFTSSTGIGSIQFIAGAGDVISGWDAGIVGMKVGGVRRLVLPPSMAYGNSRYGIVPANSTLVFEIELLAVN